MCLRLPTAAYGLLITPSELVWYCQRIRCSALNTVVGNEELEHAQYQRRLRQCRQPWQAQLKREVMLCCSVYRRRYRLLLKNDDMRWKFLEDNQVALTNNEAERIKRLRTAAKM